MLLMSAIRSFEYQTAAAEPENGQLQSSAKYFWTTGLYVKRTFELRETNSTYRKADAYELRLEFLLSAHEHLSL